jgi:hypothetical protein
MNTFFLEKTSPSPALPFCMKTQKQVHESYYSRISSTSFRRNLRHFLKISTVVVQRQNLFFEFCGLAPIGRLASVEIATLSCFNQDFFAIV